MMLIDGRPEDRLPAGDRGLHFGDGVFETMAVDAGRVLCLDRHLARLEHGCARLGIPAPALQALQGECERVCEGVGRAVVKILVTRGVGGRGYAPDPDASPTRIVARYPWPAYRPGIRNEGAAVRICETRLGRNPRLAGIKHLNRLEQVLARCEDDPLGCDEGIMLDDRERVVEGISSNVFTVHDGRLRTPEIVECGVAGVVRAVVIEQARALTGSDAAVGHLGLDELLAADECFLTNSLIGVWPVNAIGDRAMSPGPVTARVQETLIARGAITGD